MWRFTLAAVLGLFSITIATADALPASAPWPTDGWQISTPEAQGMESGQLADMFELIYERDYQFDSVLVIRNGYLVADAYIEPFGAENRHIIHSCSKSITGTLIGIAIEEGYIDGVEVPVLDFFPERDIANRDAHKEAITLEHLLSMSSGLECRDSYLYDNQGLYEMVDSDDWIQFVLDLPMEHEPGTHFEYCNGGSFLLSAILTQATGKSAFDFAQEYLFAPLGITDVFWTENAAGLNPGWGEIRMRPHDMAKFGYLYLNNGLWDGQQVVPAEWVATATSSHIDARTLSDNYGYHWWVDDNDYYMALGYGGQFIFVVPELDLIAVFTSMVGRDFEVPERLLQSHIIPAATSTEALPEDPAEIARLETAIAVLANPASVGKASPLPELAGEISGQTYAFASDESNVWEWETLTLTFTEPDTAQFDLVTSDYTVNAVIGLDGGFRVTDIGFDTEWWGYEVIIPQTCYWGLRGDWTDSDTFVIRYKRVGENNWRWTLDFDADTVTVTLESVVSGYTTSFSGALAGGR